MATETTELDKDAFMRLVAEEHLQVEGPSGGYLYTGRKGKNGWELFKARAWSWGELPVSAGVTADPAAGAQIADITVPTGKRWLFLGAYCTIVCDANAANRVPHCDVLTDGTNVDRVHYGTGTTTASNTGKWMFTMGNSVTISSGYHMVIGLPVGGIEVPAGAIIRIVADSIQVGDNLSVLRYAYKEASA